MKGHHVLSVLLLPMAILALGCEKTPAEEMQATLFEMAEAQEDGFSQLMDVVEEYDDACSLAVTKGREILTHTNNTTKALFDTYRMQVRKLDTKTRVEAFAAVQKRFREAVGNMQQDVSGRGEELKEFMKACPGGVVRQIGGMMAEMQGALEQRMFNEW